MLAWAGRPAVGVEPPAALETRSDGRHRDELAALLATDGTTT